ncbi:MAG: ABC transporter substrate-binding protein, partial [Delftia acidovorans]|nr:ABC transporter substrate-binding protein [Delftia acidovorans]
MPAPGFLENGLIDFRHVAHEGRAGRDDRFGANLTAAARWVGVAAIAAIASFTSVSADAGEKIVANGETVRIQEYPGASLQFTHWVAIDKGFCKAHGLNCQLVPIPSGPVGLQALAAGSLEISFGSTDVTMQAASRGNDVQLIVGHSPGNVYVLSVRKDVALPNASKGYPAVMQDLKGLKIGVTARGSGTELQTRALFVGAGLSPDAATYVAVGSPGTAYPTFLARQIDAVMMIEPF